MNTSRVSYLPNKMFKTAGALVVVTYVFREIDCYNTLKRIYLVNLKMLLFS